MKREGLFFAVVGLVVLGIAYFFMGTSARNREVSLRNQIAVKDTVVESSFDTAYKVVAQSNENASAYKEEFRQVYDQIIAGRYSNGGGQVAQFIAESNPEFSPQLRQKLAQVIEAQRLSVKQTQDERNDLVGQYNAMLQTFPTSLFLAGKKEIPLNVISSTRTKGVIDSGVEDNISLSGK
jgi:hypothetical protein